MAIINILDVPTLKGFTYTESYFVLHMYTCITGEQLVLYYHEACLGSI